MTYYNQWLNWDVYLKSFKDDDIKGLNKSHLLTV